MRFTPARGGHVFRMAYLTRTRGRVWSGPRLLPTIDLVVGVVVAASHEYFRNVDTFKLIVSAVLAVLLWPLLLLGIDLHVR
jgi:hypothetical protein